MVTFVGSAPFLGGCGDTQLPLVIESRAAVLTASDESKEVSILSDGQKMYHTLAAEMFRLDRDDARATLHYEKVLPGNTDIALARVATETAAQTEFLDKAISSAEQWVSLGGDQVESRQYLALLLLRSDRFDEAAKQLNHIHVLISEGGHDGLAFLTSLISMESHQKQAFKAFETYVNTHNNTTLAHLKLAGLALGQQDYKGVLRRVDALGESLSAKENVEASILRSKALYKLGQKKESLSIMGKLVGSSSVDDVSRLEYARLLMLNDNQDGAISQLETIYRNTPGNLEVLKSLVALHIAQGQYVIAEKYSRVLVENVVYESLAHHFLAEIHENRNEMDAALREYREVGDGEYFSSAQRRISELLVEQYSLGIASEWLFSQRKAADSIDTEFMYWRLEAELLSKHQDYKGAEKAFRSAYQINPDNSRMNYRYAIVAQSVGNIERAEVLLSELVALEPDNADALNALGFMLLVETERLDDAAAYISKAHQLRPNDIAILDSLGWLNYKQGKIKDASSLLMDAYQQSEDPEIGSHLIEVMLAQGQHQEAKILLERLMKQYPDDERLKLVEKKL